MDRLPAKDRSWQPAAAALALTLAWLLLADCGAAWAAKRSGPKAYRTPKSSDLRWSDRPAPQIHWTDGRGSVSKSPVVRRGSDSSSESPAPARHVQTAQFELDLLQTPKTPYQRGQDDHERQPPPQRQLRRSELALAPAEPLESEPSESQADVSMEGPSPAQATLDDLPDSSIGVQDVEQPQRGLPSDVGAQTDRDAGDLGPEATVPEEISPAPEGMSPMPGDFDPYDGRPPVAMSPQQECQKVLDIVEANRISSIGLNIRVAGEPGQELPFECTVGGDEPYPDREWAETIFTWKASAVCHKPLYFEEEALERYGHEKGPLIQPLYSGARFFATLPILPYKMGLTPPTECIYSLGHYRPGSCAPYMIEPLPLSLRAALFEAAAVVGVAAVLP